MRKIIETENAPQAIGPYSQAVVVNGLLFSAGQLGLDPYSGIMVEGGVKAQTLQAMLNLKAILEEAGSSMELVIKTTIFLLDMNDFATVNGAYAGFFPENPPARSTVQVARLPKNGLVEIEAVALVPGRQD
ncbi:MAG TPA: RidA family protein [bacterium]|jgi:2-iminobutanoate/2-iminopropanoate deaminase|nr:RidA family protein [bacterium]HOC90163.1 RidA family protein [bacterium]HOZ20852.1 RidA family protein [bacterium]